MTIQEAIKSGKPFRRKIDGKRWPTDWYAYPPLKAGLKENIYPWRSPYSDKTLIRDILATD
jgi:hypothetical protein